MGTREGKLRGGALVVRTVPIGSRNLCTKFEVESTLLTGVMSNSNLSNENTGRAIKGRGLDSGNCSHWLPDSVYQIWS